MTGRKAIVGLSLLCAIAFCAVAAPSASAEGTTAFTCVKGGGKLDFKDAHCDEQTTAGTGEFGHEAIALNTTTEIELTNEKTQNKTTEATSSKLAGELAGATLEIVCKTVKGTGTVINEEKAEKVMQSTGTMRIEQSGCTVTKPSNCKVVEPLIYDAKFAPYLKESLMALELSPREGTQMGSFTFEGSKCSLGGKTVGITGSFGLTLGGTAEGKGATLSFYTGIGTLEWGGKPYTLGGIITLRMKGGGNPITFTTG